MQGLAVSVSAVPGSLYAIEEAPSWPIDDEYLPGVQMVSLLPENWVSFSVTRRLESWESLPVALQVQLLVPPPLPS
jgi:hypothetical protein